MSQNSFVFLCNQSQDENILIQLALPQKSEIILGSVSTGSGSDLVSDQHAIFPNDFDSLG